MMISVSSEWREEKRVPRMNPMTSMSSPLFIYLVRSNHLWSILISHLCIYRCLCLRYSCRSSLQCSGKRAMWRRCHQCFIRRRPFPWNTNDRLHLHSGINSIIMVAKTIAAHILHFATTTVWILASDLLCDGFQ
jgi:hypothetical protein